MVSPALEQLARDLAGQVKLVALAAAGRPGRRGRHPVRLAAVPTPDVGGGRERGVARAGGARQKHSALCGCENEPHMRKMTSWAAVRTT